MRPQTARDVYDRIGRLQDCQAFYEDAGTTELVAHTGFGAARVVVEVGCGTGRFAEHLLAQHLSGHAQYLGVDVSPRMVELSGRRLARWGQRAQVSLADATERLDVPDRSVDRFVANYVLDLLDADQTGALLDTAERLLGPDGRLCVVSLTRGTTPVTRRISSIWTSIWSRWPSLLGGCRPIVLRPHLERGGWSLDHHALVVRWGLTSEVLVARPRRASPWR